MTSTDAATVGRVVRLAMASAALAAGAGGCVTSPMWAEANRTAVPFDHLAGTTDGGRVLVAEYGQGADARTLAIPLDPAGRPRLPFGAGPSAVAGDPFGAVTDGQAAAVRAAADGRTGGPLAADAGLVAAGPPVDVNRRGGLAAVAYRVGPGGRVEPASVNAGDCGRPAGRPFPGDVAVVLLPGDRPILPGRRRAKQAVAAAATPATLVADAGLGVAAVAAGVVLVPLIAVLVVVNHKLILI